VPTYTDLMRGFEFGPWSVIPVRGLMRDGAEERHVEPLVMDVFVVLASHHGEVVTKDQLIEEVWQGRPQTDDVITRCISALRKGLDDDAKAPKYIETVQRRGYRIMLPVVIPEVVEAVATAPVTSVRPDLWMIAVGLLAVIAIAWFALGPGPVLEDEMATVAVFPFDCRQDARESSEHLCFGFAEEAIASLKQIDDMQIVRKRTAYDDDEIVIQDSLVTGSVQIIADQVKIAAQLVNSRSGVVLWSETFDSGKNGIFDLQRQVANGLRGALDQGFAASEPVQARQVSFAVSEAYALGRYLFQKRDPQSIEDAISQFEEAIRLDPSFGPAWLGLAYTYAIWPDYDFAMDRAETFDRALEIIEQGIAEDPGIREAAGAVYGYVYHKKNQWADAMRYTEMAVNAGSAEPEDFNWRSRVLASVGLLDESLAVARRGAEIDPEYAVIMSRVAIASFWVNDLDNAAHYFAIANRMGFEASIHSLAYSLYLIRTGNIDEARLRAKRGLEQTGLDSSWVDPIFDGIEDTSKRPEAIAYLAQVYASGAMPDNAAVTLWVLLGDPDTAMSIARRSAGENSQFELEIVFIEEFREFRQHPEFMDFLAGVGLIDYWKSAGCTWSNDRVVCDD